MYFFSVSHFAEDIHSLGPLTYLPYFSLAYNMLQPSTSVMEFHNITDGKSNEIP